MVILGTFMRLLSTIIDTHVLIPQLKEEKMKKEGRRRKERRQMTISQCQSREVLLIMI